MELWASFRDRIGKPVLYYWPMSCCWMKGLAKGVRKKIEIFDLSVYLGDSMINLTLKTSDRAYVFSWPVFRVWRSERLVVDTL